MKIARFVSTSQDECYGLVRGEYVLPIELSAGALEGGVTAGALEKLRAIVWEAERALPLARVRLLPPLQRPPKFLALGANYASHIREIAHLRLNLPETQIWFNKQTSCVNGPFDDVVIPPMSDQVDYEGELAVVIGKRCRYVPAESAREVIAGYMICNDVSVRDVQLRSPTMTLGKSFDTHGPVGPWLVTADEIADPHNLRIRTWVNGELRQDANTSEMRYTVFDQIAELTSIFTLEPGDILSTGTPAGVGAAMRPPRYLKPGDRVRIEIDGIGALENRFVAECSRSEVAS